MLFGLSVALVIVAVALPSSTLSWMRRDYGWLGGPLNWIERIPSRFDLMHVTLFAWIALLLSCLWTRASWWRMAAALLGLASATELVQLIVPGREPTFNDLHDDVIGIVIGLALGSVLRWLVRPRSRIRALGNRTP